MARKPKSNGKANRTAGTAVTLHPITNIPLSELVLSPANVRNIYEEADIADLADSISRRGLLQSLSVRPQTDGAGEPTGLYEIQAGGRRYRALQTLVTAKRLDANAPVPCIIKTEGIAEDDSLAENSDRADLHPLDEFRAFAAMKSKGMTEDAIAAAYRVTPAFVRQRLRLSSASPTVLNAFATNELELDELMAFCVTEDHARQDDVYAQIQQGHIQPHAHYIRQLLTEDTVRSTDQRVKFIGLEAYEAAGGALLRDLFSENNAYLQDPDLLNRLVSEKLEAAKADLLAQGWKWVHAALTVSYGEKQNFDRLIPLNQELTEEEASHYASLEAKRDALAEADELNDAQEKLLHEIESELDALDERPDVYAAEDMARAGAFVTVSYDGRLVCDVGFVRPEDRVRAEGEEDQLAGEPTGDIGTDDHDADEGIATGKPLPDSLQQDLTSFRTVALRKALGDAYDVAFVAVLHVLVSEQFYNGAASSCLQIRSQRSFPASAPGLDSWATTQAVDKRNEALRKLLPEQSRDLWNALLEMDAPTQQQLFAHCAAGTINAVRVRHDPRGSALKHADQLTDTLGMSMAASGWTTRADNYFGRVTKGHILEAVAEAKGQDTANLIMHLKKDAMAAEAERLISETAWLPAPLRAAWETVPTEDQAGDLPAFLAGDTAEEPAAA